MLLEAAVVADFLPRDVAPTDNIQDRATAERILLSFADTARSGGTTRWALTRDARRDVLQAARTRGELGVAIAATKPRFEDSVSAALRNVLEGAVSSMPAGLSLQQLEALQLACTWVAGLPGIRTPPLAELDRELEMRRMFVGFARMVGRPDPGAPNLEASASKDRFFGRGAEIETLRAYVGVVRAETLGQKVGRVARRLERALIERKPLAIWGVGGVGKTTLIAKFMLEHAEAASDRFPFAYLDFDRSTISARNRSGLLAEMCLQARTQFSELSGPMTMLRERTQSLGQLLHSRPSGETIEQLTPLLREFRRLVDGFLSDRERFWEAERPFLLVFDTFELVQQGGDVRRVAEYLGPFQGWSRLRVVLSGRGKLDDFPGGVEGVADELGPLDPTGSASLLMALADDARRTLTESQARRLVEALAQALGQKRGGGVHPLALRLVGDLFVDRPGSQAPETNSVDIVDGLLAELESVGGLGVKGKLGETLVLGILVRRILGHIADERVRALADPGLVLRAITPLTIEVMARGTPKPTGDNKATDDADNTDFQPWQLEPEQAADIFNAFKLEVTLVQQDGSALRHRDDIRQIMTPLIRARRPKRFALLHHLAYEHFRARVAAELFAKDAASEAIYHALWCDEPLDTVDGLWPKGGGFDPKIDPEEFLPHREWACAYLRAKAGATLEIDELGLLPPHVVGDWIASQASALLAENRIDASVETLRYAAKSPAFF